MKEIKGTWNFLGDDYVAYNRCDATIAKAPTRNALTEMLIQYFIKDRKVEPEFRCGVIVEYIGDNTYKVYHKALTKKRKGLPLAVTIKQTDKLGVGRGVLAYKQYELIKQYDLDAIANVSIADLFEKESALFLSEIRGIDWLKPVSEVQKENLIERSATIANLLAMLCDNFKKDDPNDNAE